MNRKYTLYSIWEILKPFVLYYILHTVVFVLLLSLCRAAAERLGETYLVYLTEHVETVTGIVIGLSMIISVLPLIPWLRSELAAHQAGCARNVPRSRVQGEKKSEEEKCRYGLYNAAAAGLTVVLASCSSLGLNVLLTLTGMINTSVSYQEVAERQYGVVFGIGMLLYGLVSPLAEEIVFRGLVFNRMRRYFPHMAAVIVSGILFGIYHGNVVQGLYGGCMGILMAYLYERMHSFFMPCLFHATANIAVYVVARSARLQGREAWMQKRLFTAPACVLLLIGSAICIFIVEKYLSDSNSQ